MAVGGRQDASVSNEPKFSIKLRAVYAYIYIYIYGCRG